MRRGQRSTALILNILFHIIIIYISTHNRIIHEAGFSAEDRRQYRPVVWLNTIQSLVAVLRAMDNLGIAFGGGGEEGSADAALVVDAALYQNQQFGGGGGGGEVGDKRQPSSQQPLFDEDLLGAMMRLWQGQSVGWKQ